MSDKKPFVIASITLGCIGAVSAALIGITNLVTRDTIKENEIKKINAGIVEIFGENASISAKQTNKEAGLKEAYTYVNTVYTVKDKNDNQLGYAFRTDGSNMYGKLSLIIGFDEVSKNFKKFSIVVNEQTYAGTLVENYVIPVNNGDIDYDADESVKCGATYGATTIRAMIREASNAAKEIWKE